jgi:para-aminobenzoate synthetase component I
MTRSEFISQLDQWGAEEVPFLFIVDFEFEKPWVSKLDSINSSEILFDIEGFSNCSEPLSPSSEIYQLNPDPITFEAYRGKFDIVYRHLNYGDSYLTNLTTKTRIHPSNTLRDIFNNSKAKYKLLVEDEFLVFSPESFVKIRDGRIFSYPMKGTIDASIPDARKIILADC